MKVQDQSIQLWADWQRSLSPFVLRQDLIQPTFQVLVAAYSESGRVYHTLDHLQQVLDTIQQLRQEANNLSIVQLAAWFHDAVYQVRATDNEAQSAALAEQLLGNLEVPPGAIAQIQRLILQTQHHQADSPDPDSQVLLDADLAILAAPPQRYQAYAAAIRQEYGWLTDMAFRQGRRPLLQQFLQRDRLFYTETMFQQAETQARTNLQWEFRSLSLPPD